MRRWRAAPQSPAMGRAALQGAWLPAILVLFATLAAGCHSSPPRAAREPADDLVRSTPHCRIRIESSIALSEGALAGIEAEAESAYAALVADWGVPRHLPVPITIVAGGDRCHTDRNGMRIAQNHLPRFDITHEMVHYVAGPSWRPVNEGIATWFTERLRHPPEDKSFVPCDLYARAYAAAGLTVPIDSASCEAAMDFRAYMAACSFTRWLLEAEGFEKFKRLYTGPPDGYANVYGKDREALMMEWRAALAAKTAFDDDPRYRRLLERLRRMRGPPQPEPGPED